jgi:2-polyprenyl-6-methoxyphenol hydroxylase-like FAD-dependent oxidoreductase
MAGSLAAAMLGRAGIDAVLVDPHQVYPADFRCEKLDTKQVEMLRLTGLADPVLRATTPNQECWVARFGRKVDVLSDVPQRGILYDTLVNTLRAQVPAQTEFVQGKVADITTGSDRQIVKLSSGEEISARLVVVSTGLNIGLLHKLGIERQVISPNHSVSIGFDVEPAGQAAFPFSSLTYFAERPTNRMAYITLFSIGTMKRANLFGYRDLQDPWLKQFRDAPAETLHAMWPNLRKLMGDFTVPGFVKIRPVDLYVSDGHRQDGIVLVGDAFATSCPAAGIGARKVLVDVERLCNVYIPRWLATLGMNSTKIGAFYDDPIKHDCDAFSARKAFELRSSSIDPAWHWAAVRWAKFALGVGKGLMRPAATPAGEVHDHDETPIWAPRRPAHK